MPMRTTVASVASALARLLKRTTSGTFRRKKNPCMRKPQKSVRRAIGTRWSGRFRKDLNRIVSKGGRERSIWMPSSTHIIQVFMRMNDR